MAFIQHEESDSMNEDIAAKTGQFHEIETQSPRAVSDVIDKAWGESFKDIMEGKSNGNN